MEALMLYVVGLALVAVVAWAVATPFRQAESSDALAAPVDAPGAPWQRKRDEALAAIRDADFDRQLGKLSEADHRAMRAKLERSALEAIDALGEGEDEKK